MEKELMNWGNLKGFKCPKCNGVLVKEASLYFCVGVGCTFRISAEKFDSIVSNQLKPKEKPIDNFEALQNLGHNLIAEDFSDSPYADQT